MKPVIEAGVLPAHAQASPTVEPTTEPTVYTITANADRLSGALCWIENITATMSPPTAGVMIHITVSGTGPTAPPDAATNSSGVASFPNIAVSASGVFSLIFSFVDPAYGANTDTLGPYQQGAC